MPDRDEELSDALREYYRRMSQQPAPDVTGRVMMSADRRANRVRKWGAIGGGLAAAAAVVVVVAAALANHNQPAATSPGHPPTSAHTFAPTPTAAPATATAPPVAVGGAVRGFVPTDVTALSADQWWVLGYNGPSCSSSSCTRVLHSTDAGHTFSSIPTPPVAPGSNNQRPDRLRFADPLNGWLVDGGGAVWQTHDGGGHWDQDITAGLVTDLEASGGVVYAIQCVVDQTCVVERSPATGQDSWSTLSPSGGYGHLNHLVVSGAHIWAAIDAPGGAPGLVLTSADGGRSFSQHTVCPSLLGFARIYAVDGSTVWATCATGTEAAAYRSTDGGRSFTQLSGPVMLASFATIAGTSQATAVIAAQTLLRTTDAGRTFSAIEGQGQWTIVGFTTPQNGFAFDIAGSGHRQLWRTDDAGAHWHQVTFP